MGCCQSRPPNDNAVRLKTEASNTIKGNQEQIRKASEAAKTRGSKDSQKVESVGIQEERTTGKGRIKAVPEPTKTNKVDKPIESPEKKKNDSVVPASVRDRIENEEEKKEEVVEPIRKSETNKPKDYVPMKPDLEDAVKTTDQQIPSPVKETSSVRNNNHQEQVLKETPKAIQKPSIDPDSINPEESQKQVLKEASDPSEKAPLQVSFHEENAPEKALGGMPSNNQVSGEANKMDKSITSGGYSLVANDYIGGMFDKLQEDYSEIVKDENNQQESIQESADNSRNASAYGNNNQSIEKRVDIDSSIGQNQNESDSMAPHYLHNQSGTSTDKGMANDYVSNMLGNLA